MNESFKNGTKELNTAEIDYNLKKSEDLKIFGLGHKNKINIIKNGENFGLPKEVSNNKPQSNLESVNFLLYLCKEYLEGPIFTDDFGKDHGKRREWEEDATDPLKNINYEKEKDIIKFYTKNRLGVNSFSSILGYLDFLIRDEYLDSITKEKLSSFYSQIPKELTERDEHGSLKYNFLEDSEKIEIIQKFSDLIKYNISLLEK